MGAPITLLLYDSYLAILISTIVNLAATVGAMVFNKFTHLARPSLSKTLTHGYAQSVVAATQTTAQFPLGKHHTNKSGRLSTTQQHAPFSSIQTSSATSHKATHHPSEHTQHQDGGLRAYYDAWHKLHQPGGEAKEWKQFQFPRLLESKPPHKAQETPVKVNVDQASRVEVRIDRGSLDRAKSTSALDDIKKAELQGEEAAIARVNEAIVSVIEEIKDTGIEEASEQETSFSAAEATFAKSTATDADLPTGSPTRSHIAESDSASSTPLSDATAATSSLFETESQPQIREINNLHHAQAYKDIPPAFESMLSQGVKPTTDAYNALLASAIHLPLGRHQLVPKALEIYSDMLRRKVLPDQIFYSTLLQILSCRALQVGQAKDELKARRIRYEGGDGSTSFVLPSDATEYAILVEDDALSNAVRLFNTATAKSKGIILSTETYELLIHACAQYGNVAGMVQIYQHLEAQKVKPAATIFPAMISAFAKSGDLESATECYNEYRNLAIADDAGHFAIIGRSDGPVYSALVKAYVVNGKGEVGRRFFEKIVDSFASGSEARQRSLKDIQEEVNLEAIFQELLDAKDFESAWTMISADTMSAEVSKKALSRLCATAADNLESEIALRAYERLSSTGTPSTAVSAALLASYIRQKNTQAALQVWSELKNSTVDTDSLLEPAVHLASGLIRIGQTDVALKEARETFNRLRTTSKAVSADLTDQIDEVTEVLARVITKSKATLSAHASMTMLWAMLENGGLISSVAEQMLASLGPEEVASLGFQDVVLALQAQAAFIADSQAELASAHGWRLDHLVDVATKSSNQLDERTTGLVDNATQKLASARPDILDKWNAYKQGLLLPIQAPVGGLASPAITPGSPAIDNYDPYAATTDFRGSAIIIDELESHRTAQGLKEALNRFRNTRRAGRHPRYIVYAKLISSAAKEGRTNLTHDILGMARNDIPFFPDYPVVRHGWSSILDAMVGACLTAGKRVLAEQYHQEMLDIGVAPSANTYGLYITTLKASTKTFDEATEAVKIFHRAVSEGVTPSSFLYNALIGKLGKARRIDDCLRYFQEMRGAGIRPTSVTYGTIVNALCRVSDERFAEELFDEMESMPNYKPRPAPYNSLMQYFLTTKRDSEKVLAYYSRMQSMEIEPTMHTYKLLIDTYATLEPINLPAAEGVLDSIRAQGLRPEAVHYASLIHAKGCALHDMEGARRTFDKALACKDFPPQACLYQALFESMVANHRVVDTEEILDSMSANGVEMTPYIANTLIHGWAMLDQIAKSKAIYDAVGVDKREPSTYESMTRAFLTAEDRKGALATVHEMLSRGYPSAVSNKIVELVGHGANRATSALWPNVIA